MPNFALKIVNKEQYDTPCLFRHAFLGYREFEGFLVLAQLHKRN